MGGWKESGLGSRHGAGRDPQVHEAPVADGHPGLRAVARRPHVPLHRRRSPPGDRRGVRGARDQRPLRPTPSGRRWRALRHVRSPRSSRPRARPTRPASGRRAASHAAVPEGGRGRAAAGRAARRSSSAGLRELLDALAADGHGRRRPRTRLRERDRPRASATRAPRRSPGSTTLRGLAATLFYALPDLGTGRNPNWAAIGYPGPQSRRRPIAPSDRSPIAPARAAPRR